MRTTILSLIAVLFGTFTGKAQMAEPVNWTATAQKVGANEYKIVVTANVADGWYVYSQDMPKRGPVPTQVKFESTPEISLEGKTEEIGTKKEDFDQNFQMTVTKLVGQPTYVQKIKTLGATNLIRGKVQFMTCNGELCMPPKMVTFEVQLQ